MSSPTIIERLEDMAKGMRDAGTTPGVVIMGATAYDELSKGAIMATPNTRYFIRTWNTPHETLDIWMSETIRNYEIYMIPRPEGQAEYEAILDGFGVVRNQEEN
jgi:hypothetical protein